MQSYDLGERICECRKAKGWSQKELAALIGVSNKAVSKWETGAAAPKTETLIKLASALGVTTEELLSGKNPEMENLNTLDALSDRTAKMFLQNKIKTYEQSVADEKYKRAKTYLICVICLFTAVTILFSFVIWLSQDVFTTYFEISVEESMTFWEGLFGSMGMGYVVCGVYTGITLFVRMIKKIPGWATALLCVFFLFTFLFIEVVGLIMVLPEIIISLQILIHKRKTKDE